MTRIIAWSEALAEAHRLVAQPGVVSKVADVVLADAPCFQNREFPLSALPVLVREQAAEILRAEMGAYVELLGVVVGHYREQPEVRAWFGLPAAADRLINADSGPSDAPWVCRLDGYLEEGSERLLLLENNADAPAGTLFTSRVNELVEKLLASLGDVEPLRLSSLTYRGRDRFLNALRSGAAAAAHRSPGKVAHPQRLAILQPEGAANRESHEMVDEFCSQGMDTFLADPRDLRVVDGEARFGSRTADLCWNKVNTVSWNVMASDQDFVRRWERALLDTPVVHLNSFGSRYVAESKLCLAFVQEPRFAGLFTSEQRDLAARLLPWTRKVTARAVNRDETSLIDDLLERQFDYVLKEPYDIRGDGVMIGADASRSTWRAAVERALAKGHIAQQRIKPLHYPVVGVGAERADVMAISLDTYVLGGHVAGFGSKASHNSKINIFQGGQKLAVHVVSGAR